MYTGHSEAGTFEHSKCMTRGDWVTGVEATRTTGYNLYFKVVRGTESYDRTGVAGCVGWGDSSGTVGQRMPDGCTKYFTRNSSRAGLDLFRVIDSTSGHARQARCQIYGLYSGVGACQLGSSLADARQPTYLRQHRPPGQAVSVSKDSVYAST